ncbi:MAG TPA: nucleoside triphosphate pyrophosphatase [Rhodospirillales bacterium]|jgi:septum formation protein|nr:nucleoside triphosphate pyrophosphatase [Rhodospirillales bacterium]HJO69111.1 nucleoside triphosphate pyrophosphatase [Rhodospirillales bacterium]
MPAKDPDVPALVLASRSPRRLALLAQIGITPARVVPADVDEGPRRRETPAQHTVRLAEVKARRAVALMNGADGVSETLVLGADTVVACGRRILPKADDEAEARTCLSLLSGRRHRVLGGVCVITPDGRAHRRLATTRVAFKRLEALEIENYLASEEWRGKAGAYAIQGRAAAFVARVNGSYSNVVGLPLFETAALLRGLGLRT